MGSITLPSTARIKTNSDGTESFDGKVFPCGTRLVVNQDGTKSILLPNLLNQHSGFPNFDFESSPNTAEDINPSLKDDYDEEVCETHFNVRGNEAQIDEKSDLIGSKLINDNLAHQENKILANLRRQNSK